MTRLNKMATSKQINSLTWLTYRAGNCTMTPRGQETLVLGRYVRCVRTADRCTGLAARIFGADEVT